MSHYRQKQPCPPLLFSPDKGFGGRIWKMEMPGNRLDKEVSFQLKMWGTIWKDFEFLLLLIFLKKALLEIVLCNLAFVMVIAYYRLPKQRGFSQYLLPFVFGLLWTPLGSWTRAEWWLLRNCFWYGSYWSLPSISLLLRVISVLAFFLYSYSPFSGVLLPLNTRGISSWYTT